MPVFAGSTLPPEILHTIWGIADHDNNGYLTKKGVVVAVRLIAWAQKGEPVTELLLSKRTFAVKLSWQSKNDSSFHVSGSIACNQRH